MRQFAFSFLVAVVIFNVASAQDRSVDERGVTQRSATQRAATTDQGKARGRKTTLESQPVADPAAYEIVGEPIFSGPQPGEVVPAFTTVLIHGESSGEELDPVADSAGKPTVVTFQDESGVAIRGLYGLVEAVRVVNSNAKSKVQVVCVFLTDDPETVTTRYGRLFPKLSERGLRVIVASRTAARDRGTLGLDRNVAQTIVLFKEGKVTRNFVFKQGMLKVDPHVLGGVAELIDTDREVVAEWLSRSNDQGMPMRMRSTKNAIAALAQTRFREQLGDLVRGGKITRVQAGELYSAAFRSGATDDSETGAERGTLQSVVAKMVKSGKLSTPEAERLFKAVKVDASRGSGTK